MSERPRLNLKPRDENAAHALEAARAAKAVVNPFGAAKPREQIIAERLGVTEEEVLKEAVKKERPKLRLNAEQLEQRRQAEGRMEEVRSQLAEADGVDRPRLQAELSTRESDLEVLLDSFEALALEAAQRGEVQRPSERRQLQVQQQAEGVVGEGHRSGSRGGFSSGERGSYDRPARGGYGGGGEPREYDKPRGGYDKEGGGGRGGSRGGTYERAPGGYDRYERSTDREGGRTGGGGFDRSGSDAEIGARSAGDWNAVGDRGAAYTHGVGGGDRGGGSSRGGRGGGGGFDEAPKAVGGAEEGARGGRGGGGGYERRGGRDGGRGYDSTYADLTGSDYVSPYAGNQDRF